MASDPEPSLTAPLSASRTSAPKTKSAAPTTNGRRTGSSRLRMSGAKARTAITTTTAPGTTQAKNRIPPVSNASWSSSLTCSCAETISSADITSRRRASTHQLHRRARTVAVAAYASTAAPRSTADEYHAGSVCSRSRKKYRCKTFVSLGPAHTSPIARDTTKKPTAIATRTRRSCSAVTGTSMRTPPPASTGFCTGCTVTPGPKRGQNGDDEPGGSDDDRGDEDRRRVA